MQDFDLIRPENIEEACNLLASMGNKARVIAGATDLMIDLRQHNMPAGTTMLLDISSLAELNYIIEEGEVYQDRGRSDSCSTGGQQAA